MDPSALLQKLDDANVSNIIPEVQAALAGPGHSSLATRALARISSLCFRTKSRSQPALNEDEALALALPCCEAIKADSLQHEHMPCNSRALESVHNILLFFQRKRKSLYVAKTLHEFIPVLEKMKFFMSDKDQELVLNCITLSCQAIFVADESFWANDCEFHPIDFWNIVLTLGSITRKPKSTVRIVNCLRKMSVKFADLNTSKNPKQVAVFNKTLLSAFVTFSQVTSITEEADASDLYNEIVFTLWHLVKDEVLSNDALNLQYVFSVLSKFVEPYLNSYPDYMKCFVLITTLLKTLLLQNDWQASRNSFAAELQSVLQILRDLQRKMSAAFKRALLIASQAVSLVSQVAYRYSSLPPEALQTFFEFVKLLSDLLPSCCNFNCKSENGEICPLKSDIYEAFLALTAFLTLFMKNQEECKEKWTPLMPLVKDCFVCLKSVIKKASDGNCIKVETMQDSLYDQFYRVCCSTDDWNSGQTLMLEALKYCFSVERNLSSCKQQRLMYTLSKFSVCCQKQGLRQEAKAATLLGVILHLQSNTSCSPILRNHWCMLQNEDPPKAQTSLQFLERETTVVRSIYEGFQLLPHLKPHLLLWELECYAQMNIKIAEVVLNIWLALKAINPPPHILLEGSALAGESLFAASDSVNWSEFLSPSLSTWLTQVSDDEKAVALCSMAVHYHGKFLMMAQAHFNENQSKVEESSIYPKYRTVRQPSDVLSPDDVCQVKSAFPNLNLIREQNLLDTLDQAVNYWEASLQVGLNAEDFAKHFVVAGSGEYILQTGYLYCLWGYHAGAAKAFQLCRKFAKVMALDDLSLQAISGLMSTIEVQQKDIMEAENLMQSLRDHRKNSYFNKLFYTSRALQSLRTRKYSEGFDALKFVIDSPPSISTIWCYGFTKFVQASFAVLPHYELDQPHILGRDLALSGLHTVVHYIKDKKFSGSPLDFAATTHQTLSLSLWIGRYYFWRQMPSEARCVLKPELIMALKLGLATRAAEFICELAFVDLLTENTEHAEEKMLDVNTILKFDETSVSLNSTNIDACEDSDKKLGVKEPMLKPVTSERELLASSPILPTTVFNIPYVTHKSCNCYPCRNSSIQNIWIMLGHLQFKMKVMLNCVQDFETVYRKTSNAVKWIFKNCSLKTHSDSTLLQRHQVAYSQIFLHLSFVDMLIMYGKDEDAEFEHAAIENLLTNLKTYENQFKFSVQEQKMCISRIQDQEKKRSKGLETNIEVQPNLRSETTPIMKKGRKPLLQVKTPNSVQATLTDQQFYTPKAPIDLSPVLNVDRRVKENLSLAPRKKTEMCRPITQVNQEVPDSLSTLQGCQRGKQGRGARKFASEIQSAEVPKTKSESTSIKDKSAALLKTSSSRLVLPSERTKAASSSNVSEKQAGRTGGIKSKKLGTSNPQAAEKNVRSTRSSRLKKL